MKIVLLIIVVHIALAIYLGVNLNIWSDESCSMATTNGSLLQAVQKAVHFEWQPPGYFIVLWLWRQLHPSIVWARGLSVLCTALSVFLFYRLSSRHASATDTWPIWASAVLAFHPYTIFAAAELRLYAMGLLLTLVQLDWFWKGFLEEDRKWEIWYFGAAVVSLYVNILLGLCLAAQHLALWFSGNTKSAKRHLAGLIVVGFIYLPMFLWQLSPLEEKDLSGVDASWTKGLSFVVGSIAYNLAPIPRLPSTIHVRTYITIVLAGFAALTVIRHRCQSTNRHWFVWTYLVSVSLLLGLFLLAAQLRLNPRYTYPTLIATVLAWGGVLEVVKTSWVTTAAWMTTLSLCFVNLGFTYYPLCKTGDWIRVSNYLSTHEQKNEPIIVFISEVDTILKNYYRGKNQVIPLPAPQRLDRFVYADFDLKSPEIPAVVLDSPLHHVQACWLVTNEGAFRDVEHEYHQQYLQSYLLRDFRIVSCQDFVDSKICRWERKERTK